MTSPTSGAPHAARGARVQIMGRAGCHLCDVARDVVESVTAETGDGFVEVDIDADPALRARYTDDVPVVLVDGVELSRFRVDSARLRAALADD